MGNQNKQIRSMLESRLPLDSSFDAFCLDVYPDSYRLFTGQMDRDQKTNILLNSLQDEAISIIPALAKYQAERIGRSGSIARKWQWRWLVWTIPLLVVGSGVARYWYQMQIGKPSVLHSGANQESASKHLVDGFAGSIFDLKGMPMGGATVILVGTKCTAIVDSSGAFQFNYCPDVFLAKLSRPRINIYVPNHAPAIDIEILPPPGRTEVKLRFIKLDSGEETTIGEPHNAAGTKGVGSEG